MPRLRIFGLIAVGVIVLIAIWQTSVNPFGKFKSAVTQPLTETILPRPSNPPVSNSNTEITNLQASISSMLARLDILETAVKESGVPLASPSPVPSALPAQSTTLFQPQSLYLGAASTTQREWTATGLEVAINSSDYPADVNAVFEAGLSIIGGEAWARIKNKTTGAIISASEVMHNNSTVAWKTSGSFKLHTGNNIYSVELRSSSDEKADLSGSRLRLSR
jgi:hypothetical protein